MAPGTESQNIGNFNLMGDFNLFTGQMASGQTKTYICDKAVYGRYVTVYIAGNGILSLCEIQVFQAGEQS